jgi:hypothetical protein
MQMRNPAHGQNNNNGGQGRGRGCGHGNNTCNASANNSSVMFEDEVHEQDGTKSKGTRYECSGQNGHGFGRGAYGGQQRS